MEILGVKVDNLSFEEALVEVTKLVEEGRTGSPKYLVKPNAEITTYAQKDSEFKDILNSASLAPPDGVGLMVASWLKHTPLRERVGGPDLTEEVLALAQRQSYSVFFLGAKENVLERLVKVVRDRFPKLKVVGFQNGYFGMDEPVVNKIRQAKPDILFVALGFPKQEKWIADHLNDLGVPLSIAEGGSFDFISGVVPRAPSWMGKAGLEWLFRLMREPSRITRHLSLLRFVWLVLTKR